MASGVYSCPALAVTPRGNSPLVILALLRLPVGIADSHFQRLGSAFGYPLGLSASALKSFAFSAVTRYESPAIKSASFPMALLHGFLDRRSLRRKHKYYIKISATHSRLRMKRDLMDLRIEWPRQNHRTKDTKFKTPPRWRRSQLVAGCFGCVRFLPQG